MPWQRWQFHLQQNASQHVPRQDIRKAVAEGLRHVFNAPDIDEAKRLLDRLLDTWETTAPKLAAWAAEAVPEAFAVFALPVSHRRRLRTRNALERVDKELKRRTRVATLFPSAASCERLVTAVAVEISEEWTIGRIYLDMTEKA